MLKSLLVSLKSQIYLVCNLYLLLLEEQKCRVYLLPNDKPNNPLYCILFSGIITAALKKTFVDKELPLTIDLSLQLDCFRYYASYIITFCDYKSISCFLYFACTSTKFPKNFYKSFINSPSICLRVYKIKFVPFLSQKTNIS